MGYSIIIISSYLMWFYPEFYSRPLLVLPLLALLMYLLKARESGVIVLLIVVVFLSCILSTAKTSLSVSIPSESVAAIYGRVVQDSQIKAYRNCGYRILLDGAVDDSGGLFSASGSVYVLSSQCDFYYGDRVYAEGRFSGSVFYAQGSVLIERPWLTLKRIQLVEKAKGEFRELGDAGELGSLLVLGTGSNGSFALSDDAKSSGLSHILALSGMHLTIIAFLITKPLLFLLGARKGYLTVDIILLLFSFLSGWRPSLVRALIFRFAIRRGVDTESSFIISFVLLLFLFPESSSDLGALYSFVSLGGIFLLSPRLMMAIRFILPLPKSVAESFASSWAALILSIPVTMNVFGSYQLGALVTSYLLNILMSVYMVAALLFFIFPFLSIILSILYAVLEKGFELAAAIPFSSGPVPYLILVILAIIIMALHGFALHVVKERSHLLSSGYVES